jgi:hypothetical protein
MMETKAASQVKMGKWTRRAMKIDCEPPESLAFRDTAIVPFSSKISLIINAFPCLLLVPKIVAASLRRKEA